MSHSTRSAYVVKPSLLVAVPPTPPIPKPWSVHGPAGLVACYATRAEAERAAQRHNLAHARQRATCSTCGYRGDECTCWDYEA